MVFFARPFVVQAQIPDACIAASACSLIDALGVRAPQQEIVHSLLVRCMKDGTNGFDCLCDALASLDLPVVCHRHTAPAEQLIAWLQDQSIRRQRILPGLGRL